MKVNNKVDVLFQKRQLGVVNCGEFNYDVVEVLRTRYISLHAEVIDSNGQSAGEVIYRDFSLRLYCLEIRKVVDGSITETIELVAGLTHYSAVKALQVLERSKCAMEEIEGTLELYNYPNTAEINRVKVDSARRYIRRVNSSLAEKITGIGSIKLKEIELNLTPTDAFKEVAATK